MCSKQGICPAFIRHVRHAINCRSFLCLVRAWERWGRRGTQQAYMVPIIEMHPVYDVEDHEMLHIHFHRKDTTMVDSETCFSYRPVSRLYQLAISVRPRVEVAHGSCKATRIASYSSHSITVVNSTKFLPLGRSSIHLVNVHRTWVNKVMDRHNYPAILRIYLPPDFQYLKILNVPITG